MEENLNVKKEILGLEPLTPPSHNLGIQSALFLLCWVPSAMCWVQPRLSSGSWWWWWWWWRWYFVQAHDGDGDDIGALSRLMMVMVMMLVLWTRTGVQCLDSKWTHLSLLCRKLSGYWGFTGQERESKLRQCTLVQRKWYMVLTKIPWICHIWQKKRHEKYWNSKDRHGNMRLKSRIIWYHQYQKKARNNLTSTCACGHLQELSSHATFLWDTLAQSHIFAWISLMYINWQARL